MLQSIRNRSQGWFAWAIVILITIPFALWGIQEYVGGGREPAAATVNGVEIPQREVQRAVQIQRQRLLTALGENADPALLDQLRLRDVALEGLIENEVLFQTAESAGFRVSDTQLVSRIHSISAFQENGVFSPALYEQTLRNQGMLPGGFEPMLRRDLLIEQLQQGIESSAFVTKAELDELLRLRQQHRDIGYLIVPSKNYESSVTVTDEEIAAYYEQNSRAYVRPEQVSVEYLELSVDELASGIEVGEDELRGYYDEHSNSYSKPEQRRASHILIPVDADADEAAIAEARIQAEELVKRIRAGESFAELAREYSGDSGSAKEGGDLGLFGKGIMEPAFETAAFAMAQGEISEPVRTDFGFHIIIVTEIKPGTTPSFEDIRDQVATDYRRQQAEKQFYDAAEQLANLSYEHPDSLEPAAEQLGITIKTTPLFSRQGGEGITGEPKFVAAAFSPEVLEQEYNSEPIELSPVHMVVVRKKEYVPEQLQPLAEVKEKIAEQLRSEKARDAAYADAEKIVQRAAQGEDIKVLAEEYKLEWERIKSLSRNEQKVKSDIVRQAFRMARPTEGKPRYIAQRTDGGAVVIGLFAVQDGDPKSADKKEIESEKRSLIVNSGRADYADVVKLVKSGADVARLKETP